MSFGDWNQHRYDVQRQPSEKGQNDDETIYSTPNEHGVADTFVIIITDGGDLQPLMHGVYPSIV